MVEIFEIKTFQDYTNLHYKTLHVSAIVLCLLWWWTWHQNCILYIIIYPIAYVDSIFSARTHQLRDWSHGCHGMLLSGLACQRWGQLPLHPTCLNRNWTKLALQRAGVDLWKWVQGQKHSQSFQISRFCPSGQLAYLLRTAVSSKLHQNSMAPT